MYTLIRYQDGRITLRTHLDPGRLPPEEARRLLRSLRPVLDALRDAAGDERPAGPGTRRSPLEAATPGSRLEPPASPGRPEPPPPEDRNRPGRRVRAE
ncbi:MAG TPA: hypothetical protein VKB18_11305 [Gemmatimonadota bacterium]|nr:hypothetical protein [Gemmatimonadota bacterium]